MESSNGISGADRFLSELSELAGNAVIVLDSDIDSECLGEIIESLDEIGHQESLSLILNSSGGSIEYAFWIASVVRDRCDHLDVLVPNSAKSAATLIALAADRILFGQLGELGPLDPQVRDLAGGPNRRSPLEIVKGIEFLRTYYLETFDIIMPFLVRRAGMDVAHALEHVAGLLSPIAEPLYRLVNYRELGEAVRSLTVGEEYARATMHRWGPLDENSTESIVRQLVWEYPDHGYIIDIEEARRIGLSNVDRLSAPLEELYFSSIGEVYEQGRFVKAGSFEGNCQKENEPSAEIALGEEYGNEDETLC